MAYKVCVVSDDEKTKTGSYELKGDFVVIAVIDRENATYSCNIVGEATNGEAGILGCMLNSRIFDSVCDSDL